MGVNQSTEKKKKKESKMMEAPIHTTAHDDPSTPYPRPTGNEYDAIDRIAAELPNVIDEESRQQVDDYKQACDNGKGPMVACFAMGEYLSLFERKHAEAADLYRNVCFRPRNDKSPNAVEMDGASKAYPAGCYNLAKMLMTGKGKTKCDRKEAYHCFDRACRGGHGGACYLQAQILCSRPGALGVGVPHDPSKAMTLYDTNCNERGDSISCYTLAAMLLRGDRVNKDADNVSPQEAQGVVPLAVREHEDCRKRHKDEHYVIPRDPPRAAKLLQQACETGAHVTSCHNLAVMYMHGDEGVPANEEQAAYYRKKTQEKIEIFGGF